MRKKIRFFSCIAALLCVTTLGASLNITPTKAAGELTYNTFVMEKGAALRLKEGSNGMRFTAEISQDEYDALNAAGAKFGVLIVAKDLLKTTPLTPETVFGANPAFYFTNETETPVSGKIAMLHVSSPSCQNIDADSNIEIGGAIANILVDNFTRSFIGVAYVAIPAIDEQTGESTYTYHFAPYYEGKVENNTRCMYYIAQRSIENGDAVSELKQLYIDPFAQTTRFTNYNYGVKVLHHYRVHNENGEHTIIHTHEQTQYAPLNSVYTAHPVDKPTDTGKEWMDHDFIFDVDTTGEARTGLVYAGGMQVLEMYYEVAEHLDEDHKEHTLDAILANFLDVTKAPENFGLVDANDPTAWNPSEVENGINLHTGSASSNRTLILSELFFDDLRAYGVKTITFTFDSNSKNIRYALYQEESDEYLTAYALEDEEDPTSWEKLSSSRIEVERITINIDDVTPNGGVRIELHNSAYSSNGDYVFRDVVFGFESVSVSS